MQENGNRSNRGVDGGAPPGDRTGEPLDALLAALADPSRRAVLRYLATSGTDTATVDELADLLCDRAPDGRGDPDPDRVRIGLLHVHLPMLADLGVVDYDRRSRDLRYPGNDRLERLLGQIRSLEG